MAHYISRYIFEVAPFSEDTPTSGWKPLKNTIRNMQNLFPAGDDIDISTIDLETGAIMAGPSMPVAYAFPVIWNKTLDEVHAQMVEDQEDPDKGYSWIRITNPKRGKIYTFQATVDKFLPESDGAFGDVDEVEFNVYKRNDIETTSTTTPEPAAATTTSTTLK